MQTEKRNTAKTFFTILGFVSIPVLGALSFMLNVIEEMHATAALHAFVHNNPGLFIGYGISTVLTLAFIACVLTKLHCNSAKREKNESNQ